MPGGFGRHKLLGVTLYIVAVAAIGNGLVYFSRQAWITLPAIADTAIPAVVGLAEKEGVELPFTDYESLRTVALSAAQEGIAGVGRYVRAAGFQFVLLVAGLVVATSLFLSAPWGSENDAQAVRDSLYTKVVRELAVRSNTLFQSFAKVIGAQIVISTINSGLTAVFLTLNGYPYATVLIAATFMCGLLPIIGNLMSNTLIVDVGFTLSPKAALVALVFLVVIHKLEYFLNIKIIGDRIKSPMWLTLVGLVVGNRPSWTRLPKARASRVRQGNWLFRVKLMNKKILVLDDESSIRDALSKVLQAEGHGVVTADNGQEAIEKIKSEKVDVLLLDLGLPVKDGWDIAIWLAEVNSPLTIIIITGRWNQRELAEKMGADVYGAVTSLNPFVSIIITGKNDQHELAGLSGVGALVEKPLNVPQLLQNIAEILAETPETHHKRLVGRHNKLRHVQPALPGSQKAESFISMDR